MYACQYSQRDRLHWLRKSKLEPVQLVRTVQQQHQQLPSGVIKLAYHQIQPAKKRIVFHHSPLKRLRSISPMTTLKTKQNADSICISPIRQCSPTRFNHSRKSHELYDIQNYGQYQNQCSYQQVRPIKKIGNCGQSNFKRELLIDLQCLKQKILKLNV